MDEYESGTDTHGAARSRAGAKRRAVSNFPIKTAYRTAPCSSESRGAQYRAIVFSENRSSAHCRALSRK